MRKSQFLLLMSFVCLTMISSRLVSAGGGPSGEIVWSPDSQHIAYMARRVDWAGTYIADLTGNQVDVDLDLAAYYRGVSWAPSGNSLVYTTYRDEDPPLSYDLVAADGALLGNVALSKSISARILWSGDTPRLLEPSALGWLPDQPASISPGGDYVAFINGNTPQPMLSVAHIDGMEARDILKVEASFSPEIVEWSPDGMQLAFTTRSGEQVTRHLYAAAGAGALVSFAFVPDSAAVWLADGRYMILMPSGAAPYRAAQVNIYQLDKLSQQFDMQTFPLTAEDGWEFNIGSGRDWIGSPDGRYVVITRRNLTPPDQRLCIVDLLNGGQVCSPRYFYYVGARWSPDSQMLVFSESAWGADVLVMSAADGAIRRIHSTGKQDTSIAMEWSPDGEWLALLQSAIPHPIFLKTSDILAMPALVPPPEVICEICEDG